jgi:hypothetical protein
MSYNKGVKKKNLILGLFLGLGLAFFVPQQAHAAGCGAPVTGFDGSILGYPETTTHTITVDLSTNFDPGHKYKLTAERGLGFDVATSPWFYIDQNSYSCDGGEDCVSVNNGFVTWNITSKNALEDGISKTVYIDLVSPFGTVGPNQCDVGSYKIEEIDSPGDGCNLKAFQNRNGKDCYQNKSENSCFAIGESITVVVTNLKDVSGKPWEGPIGLKVIQEGGGQLDPIGGNAVNGGKTLSFTPSASKLPAKYRVYVEERSWFNETFPGCVINITAQSGCSADQCGKDEGVIDPLGSTAEIEPFEICNQIPEDGPRDKCLTCFGQQGIWTAIGCIDTSSTEGIVGKLMTVGISIAGGIALLMILASAFLFATSEGEPKRTSEAKEILTSAIIGLIFIIFSVTILQFIGVNILKIPGFGE